MAEKSKKDDSRKRSGLTCIGDVCFNPETSTVDVTLKRDGCPPEVVKKIVEGMIQNADVRIFVPPKEKKDEK